MDPGAVCSCALRNYAVVTAAYWAFALTDGALRMLVLLHFHALGYTPVQLAFLFLFYEFFGIVTNLLGGFLAARLGLKVTLTFGLVVQVVALLALAGLPQSLRIPASVAYVMAAQALSGIAKDLTKMSAKSFIKVLVPEDAKGTLFKWVALLTGSKNALKGAGFFIGGLLLSRLGFRDSLLAMSVVVTLVLIGAQAALPRDLGRTKAKAKFTGMFSRNRAVNLLFGSALFPLRRARRLVRGRRARLSLRRRLELRSSRRLSRALGHRLWRRAVIRAIAGPALDRRHCTQWQESLGARVPARRGHGGHGD